jgi:hypothetical protein
VTSVEIYLMFVAPFLMGLAGLGIYAMAVWFDRHEADRTPVE